MSPVPYRIPVETSLAIKTIRPILILFIVIAHLPLLDNSTLVETAEKWQLNSFLIIFLKNTFIKGGVPLLSFISGYLALITYLHRGYLSTIKNKTVRLLVPMFFMNLLFIILVTYPSQSANATFRPDLSIAPFDFFGWIQASVAFYRLPANAPLYFLKDLFVCFLILPLLFVVIKVRYLNILMLLWLVYKVYVVKTTFIIPFYPFIFFRIDILLAFYLGLMASYYHKSMPIFSLKLSVIVPVSYLLYCFFAAYLMLIFSPKEQPQLFLWLNFSIKLLGVMATIFLVRLLLYSPAITKYLGRLSKYSFTLFLTHVFSLGAVRFFPFYYSLPLLNQWRGWLAVVLVLLFSVAVSIISYVLWHRLLNSVRARLIHG